MKTPFKNDIFSLIWQAFKNLYPDKKCECYWEPNIRDEENGEKPYGLTDFGEDGTIAVFISTDLKIADAAEILAHELAHCAVGVEHGHDTEWEKAFDDIFNEYNCISEEMLRRITMQNKLTLDSLTGNHILSGIEVGTRLGKNWWSKNEQCGYIKFTLDGITYLALEDPDDGYRSYMEALVIVDEVCNIKLPDIKVLCRMREDTTGGWIQENDVLEFFDTVNGNLILAVGTEDVTDWYPCCVLEYYPEAMSCNERRADNAE